VYTFRAQLWQYDGPAPWYFVSLPSDVADILKRISVAMLQRSN
jgi:Domain of unknown function (DUF1905)